MVLVHREWKLKLAQSQFHLPSCLNCFISSFVNLALVPHDFRSLYDSFVCIVVSAVKFEHGSFLEVAELYIVVVIDLLLLFLLAIFGIFSLHQLLADLTHVLDVTGHRHIFVLLSLLSHGGVHGLLFTWVRQGVLLPVVAHVALHASIAVREGARVSEWLRFGALSHALELLLGLRDRLCLDLQSLLELQLVRVVSVETFLSELFHV